MEDSIYESLFPYSEQADSILKKLTMDVCQFSSWDDTISAAKKALFEHGAVILDNAGLDSLSNLSELCKTLGASMDYTGGTNDWVSQGEGVLNVGTEPPFANVSAHNEMSYSNTYPELFVIDQKSAPLQGGSTVIYDNRGLTQALLDTEFGQKLRTGGVRYIRNFHDAESPHTSEASMTSWQQVFATNDKDEAIAKAKVILGRNTKCNVKKMQHGGLRIFYNAPAFEYDHETDMDMSFISIGNHGYWFQQWPPYNQVPHIDRPWHMQFGDGTEFSEADLSLFANISNQNGYPLKWVPNKIAILKNRRFAHRHPPYKLEDGQKRELGVVLSIQMVKHWLPKNISFMLIHWAAVLFVHRQPKTGYAFLRLTSEHLSFFLGIRKLSCFPVHHMVKITKTK